jgi:hypothetical protein
MGDTLLVVLPDVALTSARYYFWNEGGVGVFLFWLQVVLWGLTAACKCKCKCNNFTSHIRIGL